MYMSVCPAMRFAMLRGIELNVGIGVGHQIWYKRPHTRVKCIDGVKGLAGVSWGQPEVK